METLDKIGGSHGFGRVDMVENRLVGIKSRETYEAAGSLSLIMAHRELEDLTLTRELQHFKTGIDQRLTELIYEGLWFSPLANALRAFIDKHPEVRERGRPSAVLQRIVSAGGAPVPAFALHCQAGHLRSRRHLQPRIGQGLHPACGDCRSRSGPANTTSADLDPDGGTDKPWGGRFVAGQDPLFERLNASIPFDHVLAPFDIEGSLAHVRMLGAIGVLTAEERDTILAGLAAIAGEVERGTFSLVAPG